LVARRHMPRQRRVRFVLSGLIRIDGWICWDACGSTCRLRRQGWLVSLVRAVAEARRLGLLPPRALVKAIRENSDQLRDRLSCPLDNLLLHNRITNTD
jgi:hypothetical protein